MIKPIAIHLPQFHPFKENDEWWGKGFTEWTNVAKAKPLFDSHYQPHLPADLGFYDLRLKEARLAQEEMAKQYGIFGFCYYHYWFNGKRLLHEPLDRKLNNPAEDLPFMLCWANENWTRRWDGHDQEVLMHQEYSDDDDLAHIRFLSKNFFADERYIKVDGKPIYLVYRPQLFPNIKDTVKRWRAEARAMGIGELYLGYVQSFGNKPAPETMGFDFGVAFQPDFSNLPTQEFAPFKDKLRSKLKIKTSAFYEHTIIDYEKYAKQQQRTPFQEAIYPGITPMWDNTPRRAKNGYILNNANPESYAEWLKTIKVNYTWDKMPEPFLFINAWNEWAEGNHLEPCAKWGRKYLENTKHVLFDT